jgi:Tetratricopeptide repeat
VRLGGLPLALKIAGAYLGDAAATPPAFAEAGQIRSYQQYQQAIDSGAFETVFPPAGQDMTQEQARELIGRTWDLTLDLLEARQMPEARPLLRLLAMFADAPLPYQMFLHPATLAASPLFTDMTGPRLWQVITTLDDSGLLDLAASGDDPDAIPVARLHPLVRDTSRLSTPPTDQPALLELAAGLVRWTADQTGEPTDPTTWPAWQLIAPHATHLLAILDPQSGSLDDVVADASSAAHQAALYQEAQGLYAQAKDQFRDVLAARLRVLGPDHPDTLDTRQEIAWMMAVRGDHTGAEAEYRDVLAVRLRVLGPDHPDTLGTRYAVAYETAERDHAGAEAEYCDVLAAQLRVLGPDHPDTLTTRNQIARMMAERGDHAGAEAEYRDVLDARLRVLGPDHPSTLITRHEIAREMAERDHAGAEAEHRDVLAAQLRVLGPDHPHTLITRHQIAWMMAVRGDHAGAEAEYREVLAAQLCVLGPDHPDTLITRHQIAWMMAVRGDHAGAEAEFRDVLTDKVRVLGPDHLSTKATESWLPTSKP